MKPDQSNYAADLRQRAEENLHNQTPSNELSLPAVESGRLLHELQVHQIELEMQNDELRQAYMEKEALLVRYSDLYDFAPVGYMTVSATVLILESNLTAATMLGVPRGVLVGQSLNSFILPEDQHIYRHHRAQLLLAGESHSCELRLSPANREPFWVRLLAVAAPDGKGGQPVCRVVISDINDRKRAEEQLVKSYVDYQLQLERANQTQSDRIKEAVEELRIKNLQLFQQSRQAAMGEMIDNIAHQWKQPLNNLGLIIQDVCAEFDAGLMTPEQMKQETAACMELILFMSQTIDDFRSFTRQDKVKEPFSIRESISRTIALVGASLKDNRIKLLVEPGVDALITGYPNEYTQVLVNLFGNARDVLLERAVANPQIMVKVYCTESQAVVIIGDNGGGISCDVIDHVFDPYFTTKEEGKGTGIGLYISKTIIEQHLGGSLTVANMAGGAEFTIVSPLEVEKSKE